MQNSASGQLNPDPKEEVPWYVKYGVRTIGTVGGGLAILLGAISAISSILTFAPLCLILSIWQMVLGFGVIVIESPCCCVFVEHVATITAKVESKPLIIKAAIYVFGSLPIVFICFGLQALFGNILIFGTGVIYGFMALGKKADRSEMAQNAQQHIPPPAPRPVDKVTIIGERSAAPPRPNPPGNPTTFEPPPPYTTDLQSNTKFTGDVGWDTSYLQSSTTNVNDPYRSANPSSSDKPPYNPFQ